MNKFTDEQIEIQVDSMRSRGWHYPPLIIEQLRAERDEARRIAKNWEDTAERISQARQERIGSMMAELSEACAQIKILQREVDTLRYKRDTGQ